MSSVLVIDDDPDVRDYIVACVTQQGHKAITAADGVAGLDVLKTVPIDLVITDICMPRKNGIEVILDMSKRFPRIPVIAVTGDIALRHSVERAAQLHDALAVLEKPFLPRQLEMAMRALLPGSRSACAV